MQFIKTHRVLSLILCACFVICIIIFSSVFLYQHFFIGTSLADKERQFAIQRDSHMYLKATPSMRDFGGLKTTNGQYRVRNDMIFRGGAWTKPTRQSFKIMKKLRIHKIIDLRSVNEPVTGIAVGPQINERGKNKAHYKVHYYNYPVNTAHQRIISYPKRKSIGEQYRFRYWYSINPTARRAYHNVIMQLIRNGQNKHDKPILITCTQGRDRSGTASAIIEYILGISKQDIIYDFLLTNEYIPQTSLSHQKLRMTTFYRHINKRYGSMYNYVHKGLNISNRDVYMLRKEYLVKN